MKNALIFAAALSLSGCNALDELGVDDAAGALMAVGTIGVLAGVIE